MTRTTAREIAIHFLFQLGFSTENATSLLERQLTKEHFQSTKSECKLYEQYPNKKQADYIVALVEGTFLHSPELDDYISRYAKNWNFARIPQVATAIMRVAMFEAMYMPDIPHSVAINDGLNIAKHYDDPEVVSFMNGILGSFIRNECSHIEDTKKAVALVDELFDTEECEDHENEEEEEGEVTGISLEPQNTTEGEG